MRIDQLSKQELVKENRRLIKNISRRLKRVEALGDLVPQTAINKFRDIRSQLPQRLNSLNDSELTSLYRKLVDVDSLKSSRVKTALIAKSNIENLADKLQIPGGVDSLRDLFNQLSPNISKILWETYGRLYDYTSGIVDKYKYEVFGSLIDTIYGGTNSETFLEAFIKSFESVNDMGVGNDETVGLLLTEKLKDFLSEN